MRAPCLTLRWAANWRFNAGSDRLRADQPLSVRSGPCASACACWSPIRTRGWRTPVITQMEMPRLLAESDYVVCLAIATEETENLMNAAAFAQMKPTAFFINASRGNLVDEVALERALDQGDHRRLCHGCRACPGPDALAWTGSPPQSDRHSAHRRSHASGHSASGARNRCSGRRDSEWPGPQRRGQRRSRHAIEAICEGGKRQLVEHAAEHVDVQESALRAWRSQYRRRFYI